MDARTPGTAAAIPPVMSNQIAQTIAEQIGRRAFFMLGAKDFTHGDASLKFRVGRNAKGVNLVRVLLADDDTHPVTAWRGRTNRKTLDYPETVIGEMSDVYVDSLHSALESLTGMYTHL